MNREQYNTAKLYNYVLKLNKNYNKDYMLNLACSTHIEQLLHNPKYTLQSEQYDKLVSMYKYLLK